MTDHTTDAMTEDRTLPAVVYALYLIGLTHGLTTIIGLIIAYASRDQAGPRMQSHYIWLIRTFWIGVAAFLIGLCLFVVSVPLSFILIGIPGLAIGGMLMGCGWIYMAVRLVIGLVHLSRGEEIPRPYAIIA